MALRVMGGEALASIPFGGEQAYVNAYDWRELNRWGISEKALPPGSMVKFKYGKFMFDANGNLWSGQNWMPGAQNTVLNAIGGGTVKFAPMEPRSHLPLRVSPAWALTASAGAPASMPRRSGSPASTGRFW
jgi:hypothetical protein